MLKRYSLVQSSDIDVELKSLLIPWNLVSWTDFKDAEKNANIEVFLKMSHSPFKCEV